jgi:hypothetical protein
VPRHVSRVRAFLLTSFLGFLGVVVLLLGAVKPSIGRFLAGGVLLGAAVVVRNAARRRADPTPETRADQLRSLFWSLVLVAVFIGFSVLIAHPWSN